jgi:hypothetical protein
MSKRSLLEVLGLVMALIVYLGNAVYQLDLPGLHYDEAFEAVPAVQLLHNQPVTAFRNSGLHVAGRLWPYTTQDYIGALNTYLSMPVLALFGTGPKSLRGYAVLVGGTTIILAWLFARALARRPGAGPAVALLLAVNPTFVFWNRQGVFVTAISAAIGLGAAYCWLRWWETSGSRSSYALAGAFLFGLGLYAKLLFIWLIGALLGAALVLNIDRWWPAIRRRRWPTAFLPAPSRRLLGALLVTILAGCWPLIAYNLQTGGSLTSIRENAVRSYYGAYNLALLPNLLARMNQLWVLLSSGHLWYLGILQTNMLAPIVFGLGCILVVGLAFKKVRGYRGSAPGGPVADTITIRRALFPFLVIGLVVGQSIVTVSGLWVTHFAILMPWPAIAMVASGFIVARRLGQRRLVRLLLVAVFCLLVLTDWLTTINYHRVLSVSGGLGAHSDAAYELAAWLEQNSKGSVVAMDWGLAAPVTFLTGGAVAPVEAFGYAWETDAQFVARLTGFVTEPEALYLWRAPDEIIFDRSDEFETIYRQHDLEETIVAAFYERSGRPVLGVTQLVPQGTAENPP